MEEWAQTDIPRKWKFRINRNRVIGGECTTRMITLTTRGYCMILQISYMGISHSNNIIVCLMTNLST